MFYGVTPRRRIPFRRVNRRVRTRTHGGVGAAGGNPRGYLISPVFLSKDLLTSGQALSEGWSCLISLRRRIVVNGVKPASTHFPPGFRRLSEPLCAKMGLDRSIPWN